MSVVVETTLGNITIDLYVEERPNTCKNFLKLCKVKYYNFCLFHNVERNFVAQTGDPTGTGRGGESIYCRLFGEQAKFIQAETKPRMKHRKAGIVSMVNNGENMHGSQFFITLAGDLDTLDGVHTIFGEVSEGQDVLEKINEILCDEQHRPYKDIRITHTVILEDPFDDPPGLEVPDRSPEVTDEILKNSRMLDDGDEDGKTMEELEEEEADKEAMSRATVLEMVGDLPSADVAPPENVLFVCKLNPVTTEEDLEIIFSRFGEIASCEVVKDKKTGNSLQYAFIEFKERKSCEDAYLKMDNVLIDDRRIHVDFSQSVAKYREWADLQKVKRGAAVRRAGARPGPPPGQKWPTAVGTLFPPTEAAAGPGTRRRLRRRPPSRKRRRWRRANFLEKKLRAAAPTTTRPAERTGEPTPTGTGRGEAINTAVVATAQRRSADTVPQGGRSRTRGGGSEDATRTPETEQTEPKTPRLRRRRLGRIRTRRRTPGRSLRRRRELRRPLPRRVLRLLRTRTGSGSGGRGANATRSRGTTARSARVERVNARAANENVEGHPDARVRSSKDDVLSVLPHCFSWEWVNHGFVSGFLSLD